jgi:Co/Zn/Cd efflux system component
VYQRKLHRLYLELLPPFISVTTLLVVTFFAMDGALQTLWTQQANSSNPTLSIMLFFSALNLLLDGVNVIFFARAHQAVLTPVNFDKELPIPSERMPFLPEGLSETQNSTVEDLDDDDLSQESGPLVNLNMCSAWTHVFADTLRSVAVLIAAGVAKLFAVITPDEADALAALLVSLVILLSCVPLIQGLFHTAREIRILHQQGLGEVVLSV